MLYYSLAFFAAFLHTEIDVQQRVFLAYRPVLEGQNALIRRQKVIQKIVSQHQHSTRSLLQSVGQKTVVETLKRLLESRVFESDLQAKLVFPHLFKTSSAQQQQHYEHEADAAKSEAEALQEVESEEGDFCYEGPGEIVEDDEESDSVAMAESVCRLLRASIISPIQYRLLLPHKIQLPSSPSHSLYIRYISLTRSSISFSQERKGCSKNAVTISRLVGYQILLSSGVGIAQRLLNSTSGRLT